MTKDIIRIPENSQVSHQNFIEHYIQEWKKSERNRGVSENTVNAYELGLNRYREWATENRVYSATPQTIAQFRNDLSEYYSPQTVNLSLSGVRSFFRFLVENGKAIHSPVSDIRGVKRSKTNRHKRSSLTVSEVRDILDSCDNSPIGIRDRAIITLMAYCALRTIEIHRANIHNLKTESERMILEVQGKGHREADEIVIVPRHQETIIRAWLYHRRQILFEVKTPCDALFISLSNRSKGKRLSTRSIREIVTDHFSLAGVFDDSKSTHSLRHTAITRAIKAGASPLQVQAMARHASFDTTQGYVHEVSRIDNPAEDLIEY